MPGENFSNGIPYVRVVDMQNGSISSETTRRTMPEISARYNRSFLQANDVLISIRGHVGRLAIVPAALQGANITQDTARIAVSGLHPLFVCEALRTPSAQSWMAQRTKGVAVRGLNSGDLKDLPIIVPPVELHLVICSCFRLSPESSCFGRNPT
jgi:type I restriction enzyme S subunit